MTSARGTPSRVGDIELEHCWAVDRNATESTWAKANDAAVWLYRGAISCPIPDAPYARDNGA
ncbi:MAG: hypothetical protein ACJA07_001543 [Rhodococcus sp. (in: high G+C Gram-positive bacteria)]|jgi:hypothetical protein